MWPFRDPRDASTPVPTGSAHRSENRVPASPRGRVVATESSETGHGPTTKPVLELSPRKEDCFHQRMGCCTASTGHRSLVLTKANDGFAGSLGRRFLASIPAAMPDDSTHQSPKDSPTNSPGNWLLVAPSRTSNTCTHVHGRNSKDDFPLAARIVLPERERRMSHQS